MTEIANTNNINQERLEYVAKSNEMIQKGKYGLSTQQLKLLAYAISKIKPTDVEFQEYKISFRHFCKILGYDFGGKKSYKELKDNIDKLYNVSWWVINEGKYMKLSWFDTIYVSPNTSEITLIFHRNMMPYLLELAKAREENNRHFIYYELINILPMKSRYSIRLYELLRTHAKTKEKKQWEFQINELKERILDVIDNDGNITTAYDNFAQFRRKILEKAISEINQYTDLFIEYRITEKQGKKVNKITFYITVKDKKTKDSTFKDTIIDLDSTDNENIKLPSKPKKMRKKLKDFLKEFPRSVVDLTKLSDDEIIDLNPLIDIHNLHNGDIPQKIIEYYKDEVNAKFALTCKFEFNNNEIQEIINIIDKRTDIEPNELFGTLEGKRDFLEKKYNTLEVQSKKQEIKNRFGYLVSLIDKDYIHSFENANQKSYHSKGIDAREVQEFKDSIDFDKILT